jgi:serine/threonine protein kinase
LYNRLYSRSSASKAQQQQRQRQQQQAALATAASSSSSPAPQLRPRKAGGGGGSKGMLPPPLSVFEVLRIAIDVSHAMVYLHALQPQVVHRDLKPQNVLLDLQGMAKVRMACAFYALHGHDSAAQRQLLLLILYYIGCYIA